MREATTVSTRPMVQSLIRESTCQLFYNISVTVGATDQAPINPYGNVTYCTISYHGLCLRQQPVQSSRCQGFNQWGEAPLTKERKKGEKRERREREVLQATSPHSLACMACETRERGVGREGSVYFLVLLRVPPPNFFFFCQDKILLALVHRS